MQRPATGVHPFSSCLIAAATVWLLWLAWQALVAKTLVTPGRQTQSHAYHGLGWFDKMLPGADGRGRGPIAHLLDPGCPLLGVAHHDPGAARAPGGAAGRRARADRRAGPAPRSRDVHLPRLDRAQRRRLRLDRRLAARRLRRQRPRRPHRQARAGLLPVDSAHRPRHHREHAAVPRLERAAVVHRRVREPVPGGARMLQLHVGRASRIRFPSPVPARSRSRSPRARPRPPCSR